MKCNSEPHVCSWEKKKKRSNCNGLECGETASFTHTHSLDPKEILHPFLSLSLLSHPVHRQHRVGPSYRGRMEVGSHLSLSAEQPRDADPTLSEGAAHCQAEPGALTTPRRRPQGGQKKAFDAQVSAQLANSAAAVVAVVGFSMWCGFKPHSLIILSFPNIQHPCTLLTSGLLVLFCWVFFVCLFVFFLFLFVFSQKIGDFQRGVSGVIPMVTDQA